MIHDQLHRVYNPPPHEPNALNYQSAVHIPTLLGPDDAIQAPSFIFEKILVPRRLAEPSVSWNGQMLVTSHGVL